MASFQSPKHTRARASVAAAGTFPKIVMEPSPDEEGDYVGPEDLGIGARVFVLGRLVSCGALLIPFLS